MTVVGGLDQSLTSFGAARVSSGSPEPELRRWQPGARRGDARLDWLLGNMREFVGGCDLVIVEGLAFGAKGSSLLDLAGLFTLVTHELWKMGIPYAVVAPYTRAKYVTGRAGAGKDECLIAVLKRYPGIDVTGNDQADALTLAAMGADRLGFPLAPVPAAQRAVLTAVHTEKAKRGKPVIAWPELRKEPADAR